MKVKNTYIFLLGVLLGTGIFSVGEVDALSYQNNVNVNFTFNPAVTIALSGTNGTDLIINELSPGSASDSNIITVTAGSNSGAGYYLYASAGSATSGDTYYDTNALKNGSNTFTSLTSNVGTLNALTAGQWGYTYSAHDANTWVSGNVGSTSSGYNGLPKATSGNGVTLLNASTVGTAELDFKIAAKADSNQTSGTYSNVINFTAVAKPVTTNYTITYYDGDTAMSTPAPVAGTISSGNDATITLNSSATKSGYILDGWCYGTLTNGNCSGTIYQPGDSYTVGNIGGTATINLYAMWETLPVPAFCTDSAACMQTATVCDTPLVDDRTGVSYLTATISGQCYMEQNLYLPTDLTLTKENSNITRDTWATPSSYSIPSYSYDTAYMKTGTHTNNTYDATGGWYNICAASAGTVCSDSVSANADEDICPAGWRLPTNAEMGNVASANRSNWKFYAGFYANGSLQGASSSSFWWSATAPNASSQYFLYYSNGSLGTSYDYNNKASGLSVRCVRK